MSSVSVSPVSMKESSYSAYPAGQAALQKNQMSLEAKPFSDNRKGPVSPRSAYFKKALRVLPMVEVGLFFTSEVGYKIPVIATSGALAKISYAAGGSVLLESALKVKQGVDRLQNARRIGDQEGKRRARSDIAFGTVSSSASSLEMARLITGAGVIGLGFATNLLAMIASSMKIGICMLNIYRSSEFYSSLSKLSENQTLKPSDRLIETIEFLKNQASLTKEERITILEDGKRLHANLGAETQTYLTEKKLKDLAQTKIERFKRRCSLDAARSIIEKSNYLLEKLHSSPLDVKVQREAQLLIKEVLGATKKRMAMYGVAALISSLALTGLIFSTIVSVGLIPLILYGASSLLVLSVSIYPMIAGSSREKKDLVALSVAMDSVKLTN